MRKAIKAAAIAVGIAAALNGIFWLVMHIAAETGIKSLDLSWNEAEA